MVDARQVPGAPPALPGRPMPRPSAQAEPYVRALGPVRAVIFLLHFGGAELNIPRRPRPGGTLAAVIGEDGARALAAALGNTSQRVPLASRWLAQMLAWQGHSVAETARRLRTTDVTVRRWLKSWHRA
jgi:hypothetical protein